MEDRIDRYILSQMGDSEREAFEQELSRDEALRREVQLQREIVTAVQLKAAGDMLRTMRQQERAARAEQEERERARERELRRRRIFSWGFATVAVAAVLVVGVFFHIDIRNDYITYGQQITLQDVELRGGESAAEPIIAAMDAAEYDRAMELIEAAEARTLSVEGLSAAEAEYERAVYVAEQEDVQWLKAVTLMRMGKWWQARRVLKDIASSDSYYREEAQAVLDALHVF